ncbi:MAG: helix-turn-helix domain-containing protein, partial [Weissella cibaria]
IDKLREVITLSFDNQAPWFDEELRFGLGSIYSLGIGSGSYRVANLVPDVRRKFQEIYDDVCEVYQDFFGLSLSQPELELIQKALFSLNFRMLFFRQNGITHPINRQFSMSTFPIHTAFTERVVAHIAPHFGLSEAEVSTAIFNEYLNTFVLVLNNSEILPVINVTVDMIDMPALEQIIIERLAKWQSVNLNITTEFTSETDLYISDVQLDSQVPGFAWRSFPENPEEKALHEKLIELTVQRFQALTGKI